MRNRAAADRLSAVMLEKIPGSLGHALSGARAGMDKLVWAEADAAAPETITVTSSAFADGAALPASCTEDGAGLSPPLAWRGAPEDAAALLLIVEDADSPTPKPILHLLAYDVPAGETAIGEGALNPGHAGLAGRLGKNSFGKSGWLPPDPPTGHGAHRYVFQLFALDRALALESGADKKDVLSELAGKVLARGRLIGTYERRG